MREEKAIWFCFPLIVYGVLAFSLRFTRGFYSLSPLLYVTICFLILILWITRAQTHRLLSMSALDKVLAISLSLFLVLLLEEHKFYFVDSVGAMVVLQSLTALAGIFSTVATFRLFRERGGSDPAIFKYLAGAACCLLAAKVLVPLVSQQPWIDVWVHTQEAVDHLLHGANPYVQTYHDIYEGQYDYPPGFHYWPSILLWATPFKWAFGDFRYGYLLCDVITAASWISILRKRNCSLRTAVLFVLLWWAFPVTFYVPEMAWTEPWIIMMLSLVALSLFKEKWVWAAIFLGILCAGKQYVIFIAILTLVWVWRVQGLKSAFQVGSITTLTFAIIMFPFALMDWEVFYRQTITTYLEVGLRTDAFSWAAFLKRRLGVLLPGSVTALLYVLFTAALTRWLWKVREKISRARLMAALLWSIVVVYGLTFLISKMAFCNYYYFLSFCILFAFSMDASGPAPSIRTKSAGA